MISSIGQIQPVPGRELIPLKRVSIQEKDNPSSFYNVNYLLTFVDERELLITLTPSDGTVTEEDWKRYDSFLHVFGAPSTLLSGAYRPIENAEGVLLGITKVWKKKTVAVWNGTLPSGYNLIGAF